MRESFIVGWVCAILFALRARVTHADTFTVFAAASLKSALDEITRSHEGRTKDKVVVSYAASSAVARQIEQSAPAGSRAMLKITAGQGFLTSLREPPARAVFEKYEFR